MVLHDIMRCLILCIPLQEPNKTQNEVPQKFEKTWHHRDAVPRHHVMPRQFGPNCLGIIFGKRGASFLSLEVSRSSDRLAIKKMTGSSDSGDPKMGPVPRRSYLDPETLSLGLTRELVKNNDFL